MVHFFTKTRFKASLLFQMSIRVFRQACARAIFPVRVTLFPSGMLYITNILSIYQNNVSFCPESNVKHDGEGLVSKRLIVLIYGLAKLRNCRFPENLNFDLS